MERTISVQSGIARSASESRYPWMWNGLVGSWAMIEGGGLKAFDWSGNGNHGTLTNGPTWAPGKTGSVLSFDGTDDYVDIPSATLFNIGTGNFTASAWIKAPDTANNYKVVLSSWTSDPDGGHFLVISGGGGVYAYFGSPFGIETTLIDNNQWHLIILTRTGTTGNYYIDGVSVGSGVVGANNASNGTPKISTRGVNDNPSQRFNGSIDDVRIYNRAISASEVKAIYETGPKAHLIRRPTARTFVLSSGNRRRRLLTACGA